MTGKATKQNNFYFLKRYTPMTPVQAATIIQKTWRGYLTRKLLDQYINDEQSKLNYAKSNLRSK